MSQVHVHSFRTNWGTIRTAATERGLALIALPGESRVSFENKVAKLAAGSEVREGGRINTLAQKQIEKYLAGKLRKFDLELDQNGTPFQRKVLQQVARIPYGETRTYSEIARAVRNPKAARAVGSANGQNKLPLIIPCHRVVAVNGPGGYGGGLELKRKLLKLEGGR